MAHTFGVPGSARKTALPTFTTVAVNVAVAAINLSAILRSSPNASCRSW